MRLQEVYKICQTIKDKWVELSFEEKKQSGGSSCFILSNSVDVKNILILASEIPSLKTFIEKIKCVSPAFDIVDGQVVLDSRGKNALTTEYQQLFFKISTITDLFDSFEYKQNENGFDIKLPPSISLSDLGKCSKDLDKIFSTCPLLSNTDGIISLSSVDVGSIWLTFVITGTAITTVLTMIAALVDKALIIRSHYLTTKAQLETARALQMGNDMIERMEKDYEDIGKKLIETHCNALCEQYNVNDPEDFERMKNSLNLLSEWMNKGMEIHAAVKSPIEVQAVFPTIEKQFLSTDEIALLSDKNDTNET